MRPNDEVPKAVNIIAYIFIGGFLIWLGYIWLVAIPEQQAIIDKNEAMIKEMNL